MAWYNNFRNSLLLRELKFDMFTCCWAAMDIDTFGSYIDSCWIEPSQVVDKECDI